jgi:hypothetical protein
MTTTETRKFDITNLDDLRDLLRARGPCLTIQLPAFHPGEASGSSATLLRTKLGEAARRLESRRVSESLISELLEPLKEFAARPELTSGGPAGRWIFRSPEILAEAVAPIDSQATVTIGGSFAIRKLVSELQRAHAFFALLLTKTRVAVFRCEGTGIKPVDLPRGVPPTLAEAMAFEPPDHDLENRSTASGSTMTRKVRFGTGSGRERKRDHLADYYKLVDDGLDRLFREANLPVIPAGVDEDTKLFRSLSNEPLLTTGSLAGNTEILMQSPKEFLRRAAGVLDSDALGADAKRLAAEWEHFGPGKITGDFTAILKAAFEGRIGELYLDSDAVKIGHIARRDYQGWGDEDLLNLLAVQTLVHHGAVIELPLEKMPGGTPAIAVLRY